MVGIIVCYKIFLDVVSTSSLLSCGKNPSTLLMKLIERGFMITEFLLEDLSLSRWGEFRKSFSLHLLFFKYLQLKIFNIWKWHIFVWHILNPFMHQYFIKLAPEFRVLINQGKNRIWFLHKNNNKYFLNFWIWKLNS